MINLQQSSGLDIRVDPATCEIILGESLNRPSYRVRMLHDLDPVWASPVTDPDRMIYQYTSGLWLANDDGKWKKSNVIYGIVVFAPGVFSGEFNKSSGQYHPVVPPNTKATPEAYTVLHGTGHFMLQHASPPYEVIDDVVLMEVNAGETFIVPPDYGHLQINVGSEPLIFSYAVMDGMSGVYDPFKNKGGAMYYEMSGDTGLDRYVFNSNYRQQVPLRIIKAGEICQLSFLNENVTYQTVRDNLGRLQFLTDPELFPKNAAL